MNIHVISAHYAYEGSEVISATTDFNEAMKIAGAVPMENGINEVIITTFLNGQFVSGFIAK